MSIPVNEAIEALSQKLDLLIQKFNPLLEKSELFSALAKAQAEMRTAKCDKENRYFKTMFEDLESVMNASRPALTKYGLSVIHVPMVNDDGAAVLKCILAHSSGQFIESTMRMLPLSNDPQSLGSCFQYLRRLSYSSLVGVAAQNEDDDAERAMADVRMGDEKGTTLNHKYNPKEQTSETITREQLDEIEYELAAYPDIGAQILKGLRIMSLADMPRSKYRDAITKIREIVNARSGKR